MTDFVFPQDGDYGDAADFASWLDHGSMSSHVSYGLEFQNIDWAGGEFDTTKGKAFLRDSSEQGARSGETREGVVYEAFLDTRSNVALADDDGVNYIYATFDVKTNDSASLYVTANQGDDPTGGPFVMIGTIDAGRETVENLNRGPDITPEEVQFDGTNQDPTNPDLGTQWFREDEGIHYAELPGGSTQIPVAREFIVENFEDGSLNEYVGDKSDYSFDQNASDGQFALRCAVSNGQKGISVSDKRHIPQKGHTFTFDVLIGSEYTQALFFYGLQTIESDLVGNDGYYVLLDAEQNLLRVARSDRTTVASTEVSAPIIEQKDEFITVTINWGEDGTHRCVLTDQNNRTIEEATLEEDTYNQSVGFGFLTNQVGSGAAEAIYDNVRTIRSLDDHVLDAEDTVSIGGEQTMFKGAVQTGPIHAPQNSKGIHTNQAVTGELNAGDEVGYLLGTGGADILDIYGEADGSGGVQNLAAVLRGDAPLKFEDQNGQIVTLRVNNGDLVVEDSAGNTTTLS